MKKYLINLEDASDGKVSISGNNGHFGVNTVRNEGGEEFYKWAYNDRRNTDVAAVRVNHALPSFDDFICASHFCIAMHRR